MKVSYSTQMVTLVAGDKRDHLLARIEHIPDTESAILAAGAYWKRPNPWLVWQAETTVCGLRGAWEPAQLSETEACDGCIDCIEGAFDEAPDALKVPAAT